MPDRLELTTDEDEYFRENRALTTDGEGRTVLAGLTLEETIWWIEHKRRDKMYRLGGSNNRPSSEDRKRSHELSEKHERVRLAVIGAELFLHTENPTKN